MGAGWVLSILIVNIAIALSYARLWFIQWLIPLSRGNCYTADLNLQGLRNLKALKVHIGGGSIMAPAPLSTISLQTLTKLELLSDYCIKDVQTIRIDSIRMYGATQMAVLHLGIPKQDPRVRLWLQIIVLQMRMMQVTKATHGHLIMSNIPASTLSADRGYLLCNCILILQLRMHEFWVSVKSSANWSVLMRHLAWRMHLQSLAK